MVLSHRVIFLVSIDGLAVDTLHQLISIDPTALPTLKRFLDPSGDALGTLNARTDAHASYTLPNHVGMFTSLGTKTSDPDTPSHGHQTFSNSDGRETAHQIRGEYAWSIFDQLASQQMKGVVLAGKGKFQHIADSYEPYQEVMGTGTLQEIDFDYQKLKVDPTVDPLERVEIEGTYRQEPHFPGGSVTYQPQTRQLEVNGVPLHETDYVPIPLVQMALTLSGEPEGPNFIFLHFKGTDSMGHGYGWETDNYRQALIAIDQDLGFLMNVLQQQQREAHPHRDFWMVLTSDHGGGHGSPRGGSDTRNHDYLLSPVNHTIMLGLWRASEPLSPTGSDHDLYRYLKAQPGGQYLQEPENKALNPELRRVSVDPSELAYDFNEQGTLQGPLRNLMSANFCAALLDLPPIPQSWAGVIWQDPEHRTGQHLLSAHLQDWETRLGTTIRSSSVPTSHPDPSTQNLPNQNLPNQDPSIQDASPSKDTPFWRSKKVLIPGVVAGSVLFAGLIFGMVGGGETASHFVFDEEINREEYDQREYQRCKRRYQRLKDQVSQK